jgi:hypothetical protein
MGAPDGQRVAPGALAADDAGAMSIRVTSDQDRAALDAFAHILDRGEYDIPTDEARRISRAAIAHANRIAETDPHLGSGRDVRAIYALGLGISLGAHAWRQALQDAESPAS